MQTLTRNTKGEQIRHAKAIINGKLYNTEKSKKLFGIGQNRILFVTPKGNYFSCESTNDSYRYFGDDSKLAYATEQFYFNIQEEPLDRLKEIFGRYDIEKYIELFGEPEEA